MKYAIFLPNGKVFGLFPELRGAALLGSVGGFCCRMPEETLRPDLRDFLEALETTTAIKRRKESHALEEAIVEFQTCHVTVVACRGRCKIPAKVVISRLLACNCCSSVVVVSAAIASRSLPLWGLGGLNWDTRKSLFRGCCSLMCCF